MQAGKEEATDENGGVLWWLRYVLGLVHHLHLCLSGDGSVGMSRQWVVCVQLPVGQADHLHRGQKDTGLKKGAGWRGRTARQAAEESPNQNPQTAAALNAAHFTLLISHQSHLMFPDLRRPELQTGAHLRDR